jgi:formate hydrogenlyase subunit 4
MSMVVGGLLNLILVVLLAPLLEGIIRKLKAVVQSRKGPPVIQPYIDLVKLLGKEDLRVSKSLLFRIAPLVALGGILVAATLTPIGTRPSYSAFGDAIVWLYVISLTAVAVILGAFASGNPFSYMGASREMMMILTVEPIAAIALITVGFKAKSLVFSEIINWQLTHGPSVSTVFAGIAFFLTLQANIGKIPFDIVEAETEVAEGPFLEYSGPRLAAYKLMFYIRQLIFSLMLVSIFVPWPDISFQPVSILLTLAKVLVVYLLVGVIDVVNPRLRIDQSMVYMSRLLFVALAALAFAIIGV